EHAGQAVAERKRQPGRWPAREAVEVSQPAGGFGHRGVTSLLRVRPGLPVAGYPNQDDARVTFAQHVVAQVPLLQRARPEVLNHDVGLLDELEEQLTAAWPAQVERDRSFVARMHGPEDMVPIEFGLAPGAQRVRGAGRFHLD